MAEDLILYERVLWTTSLVFFLFLLITALFLLRVAYQKREQFIGFPLFLGALYLAVISLVLLTAVFPPALKAWITPDLILQEKGLHR